MQILISIIPIFLIIGLGSGARRWNLITADFLQPANRLVYYISIPAFIFNAVVKGNPGDHLDIATTALTLLCAAGMYCFTHLLTRLMKLPEKISGTFVQASSHGNQGYFGLPVVFYYLGEESLGIAALICGILMILQNILSIFFLQINNSSFETENQSRLWSIISKLKSNPVILAVLSGLLVSSLGIRLPEILQRTLEILGGLAPPLALLLIGASLSLYFIREHFYLTLLSAILKLLILPLSALILFRLFHMDGQYYWPALILLATPTATMTYIMAGEMKGEQGMAVATISMSTLLAGVSYPLWLATLELVAKQ